MQRSGRSAGDRRSTTPRRRCGVVPTRTRSSTPCRKPAGYRCLFTCCPGVLIDEQALSPQPSEEAAHPRCVSREPPIHPATAQTQAALRCAAPLHLPPTSQMPLPPPRRRSRRHPPGWRRCRGGRLGVARRRRLDVAHAQRSERSGGGGDVVGGGRRRRRGRGGASDRAVCRGARGRRRSSVDSGLTCGQCASGRARAARWGRRAGRGSAASSRRRRCTKRAAGRRGADSRGPLPDPIDPGRRLSSRVGGTLHTAGATRSTQAVWRGGDGPRPRVAAAGRGLHAAGPGPPPPAGPRGPAGGAARGMASGGAPSWKAGSAGGWVCRRRPALLSDSLVVAHGVRRAPAVLPLERQQHLVDAVLPRRARVELRGAGRRAGRGRVTFCGARPGGAASRDPRPGRRAGPSVGRRERGTWGAEGGQGGWEGPGAAPLPVQAQGPRGGRRRRARLLAEPQRLRGHLGGLLVVVLDVLGRCGEAGGRLSWVDGHSRGRGAAPRRRARGSEARRRAKVAPIYPCHKDPLEERRGNRSQQSVSELGGGALHGGGAGGLTMLTTSSGRMVAGGRVYMSAARGGNRWCEDGAQRARGGAPRACGWPRLGGCGRRRPAAVRPHLALLRRAPRWRRLTFHDLLHDLLLEAHDHVEKVLPGGRRAGVPAQTCRRLGARLVGLRRALGLRRTAARAAATAASCPAACQSGPHARPGGFGPLPGRARSTGLEGKERGPRARTCRAATARAPP
jgi:hypothetical protein